jgi:hypothetical protein
VAFYFRHSLKVEERLRLPKFTDKTPLVSVPQARNEGGRAPLSSGAGAFGLSFGGVPKFRPSACQFGRYPTAERPLDEIHPAGSPQGIPSENMRFP